MEALAAELRRQVAGEVWTGRAARARSTDFGGLARKVPLAAVCPAGEEDVARTLATARRHGLPVTVQGSAHSVNGQALSEGGVLLVNVRRGEEPPQPLPGDRFEVSARSRWRDVERSLHRCGRAVPVLADYLGLSVGGTLSVGGYGADSVSWGAVVDQVERLHLVLPGGTAAWCSPDENAELFRHALAGLGQVGVLERVVLRTRPYRPVTVLFTYRHRSLAELVESLAWLDRGEPGPQLCKALVSRGRCISTYGVEAGSVGEALSVRPPDAPGGLPVHRRLVCPAYRSWRSRAVSLWLSRFVGCRKIWSDYLLDHAGLRAFAALTEELLADDAFAGCLKCLYIVPIRRPPGALDLPLEAAGRAGSARFGIGFYCMVPSADPGALESVQHAARACLDRCRELGGRPYLYGWHELEQRDLEAFYGTGYARLLRLRQELDPAGLFQAGKLAAAQSGRVAA